MSPLTPTPVPADLRSGPLLLLIFALDLHCPCRLTSPHMTPNSC